MTGEVWRLATGEMALMHATVMDTKTLMRITAATEAGKGISTETAYIPFADVHAEFPTMP